MDGGTTSLFRFTQASSPLDSGEVPPRRSNQSKFVVEALMGSRPCELLDSCTGASGRIFLSFSDAPHNLEFTDFLTRARCKCPHLPGIIQRKVVTWLAAPKAAGLLQSFDSAGCPVSGCFAAVRGRRTLLGARSARRADCSRSAAKRSEGRDRRAMTGGRADRLARAGAKQPSAQGARLRATTAAEEA